MRVLIISLILVSFHLFSFAQQFQLEATIDKNIEAIFDIDGDGICEYMNISQILTKFMMD